MTTKIKIENEITGAVKRVTLPRKRHAIGEYTQTGIKLLAVYVGRNRVIAEYYSQWQTSNDSNECTGTYYREVSSDQFVRILDLVPTTERTKLLKADLARVNQI